MPQPTAYSPASPERVAIVDFPDGESGVLPQWCPESAMRHGTVLALARIKHSKQLGTKPHDGRGRVLIGKRYCVSVASLHQLDGRVELGVAVDDSFSGSIP